MSCCYNCPYFLQHMLNSCGCSGGIVARNCSGCCGCSRERDNSYDSGCGC